MASAFYLTEEAYVHLVFAVKLCYLREIWCGSSSNKESGRAFRETRETTSHNPRWLAAVACRSRLVFAPQGFGKGNRDEPT